MRTIHVEASLDMAADAREVYDVLADYVGGHPHILPREYFTELKVEQGGRGAGTIVRTRMHVMGVDRDYRLVVDEPQPGRVLRERDEQAGVVTTFTVTPAAEAGKVRVQIASGLRQSPGIAGLFELVLNPPIIRRIYEKELRLIADYMASARKGQGAGMTTG